MLSALTIKSANSSSSNSYFFAWSSCSISLCFLRNIVIRYKIMRESLFAKKSLKPEIFTGGIFIFASPYTPWFAPLFIFDMSTFLSPRFVRKLWSLALASSIPTSGRVNFFHQFLLSLSSCFFCLEVAARSFSYYYPQILVCSASPKGTTSFWVEFFLFRCLRMYLPSGFCWEPYFETFSRFLSLVIDPWAQGKTNFRSWAQ